MKVELSTGEMFYAGSVGLRRQVESIGSRRTPQFPESRPGEMFSTHIMGAMAELAAAKALGLQAEPTAELTEELLVCAGLDPLVCHESEGWTL